MKLFSKLIHIKTVISFNHKTSQQQLYAVYIKKIIHTYKGCHADCKCPVL